MAHSAVPVSRSRQAGLPPRGPRSRPPRPRLGWVCVLVLLGLLGSACTETAPPRSSGPGSTGTGGPATVGGTAANPAGDQVSPGAAAWPSAQAVQAENARPGQAGWRTGAAEPPSTKVEGFASRASVKPGEPVSLYVHSAQGPVVVQAYRIGWYGGVGSRLVWTSAPVTQVDQPKPQFEPATRTWSAANWTPSLPLPTTDWPPGDYVLHLQAAGGAANLVPLTVRSPSVRGAVVLVNANTTWQAYNRWGGTSLYRGPTGFADRAYAVSHDRPIDYGLGTGDFVGNELAVTQLAEKLGLPVAYVTDTDLHSVPQLLDGARAVVTLGHDEYYSQAMRDAIVAARDGQGTNLAFLGANAIYRHIRLGPTPVGPDRLETDYKDGSLDPVARTNPAEATWQWRQLPLRRPESVITGVYYQCNPVHADMVVAQPDSWLLAGTGLRPGDRLPGLVGAEYDQVTPSVPTPRPIEVIFHSPVTCSGFHQFSDAAYYSTPSGAGVFATGTSSWICGLIPECTFHPRDQRLVDVVTQVTTTMLTAFSAGPAGAAHPARDNLDALRISTATIRDMTK